MSDVNTSVTTVKHIKAEQNSLLNVLQSFAESLGVEYEEFLQTLLSADCTDKVLMHEGYVTLTEYYLKYIDYDSFFGNKDIREDVARETLALLDTDPNLDNKKTFSKLKKLFPGIEGPIDKSYVKGFIEPMTNDFLEYLEMKKLLDEYLLILPETSLLYKDIYSITYFRMIYFGYLDYLISTGKLV